MARLRLRISSVFVIGQQSTFIVLHVKQKLTSCFQFPIKVLAFEGQASLFTLF